MSKGAVHEGPDFPSELWDERAKKEMREVVVRCWWVSPTNGAPMPDKVLNESSPDRTGNFTFAANPAELMNLPAWLQTTHMKTGYWYLDFHEQGSGRYFLRWKVYLGAPANMAQGLGGSVMPGMSVAEQIAARSGAPATMNVNGQQQVLAPGTQIWSRELNSWVTVSGGGQHTLGGGGQSSDPAIAALSAKLEQMERASADRVTADRHSAELTREREAAKERETVLRDEMKSIREAITANATPKEGVFEKALALVAPLLPAFLDGRREDARAAEVNREAAAKRDREFFELMLKQQGPQKVDPMMVEMMKMQTAQVAAQRGSDVQLYESLARGSLEQATMAINVFKALKEAEPELNPIAETVGKTFMGVAHEVGSYFRSRASMPGLPADAGASAPAASLQEQVNQAVGTFNKLTPDQQMELANYMASVAQQRAAGQQPAEAGAAPAASPPPPTVTPAPGAVNPAVTVTADASPPSNGTATPVTTDQVRAYLKSQKVDPAYETPEWLRILTDLHNQRAEEEISAMLADHLLHLWRFGTLPEGLEILDPKDADVDDVLDDMRMRLDLFMQMLPVYKTAPVYTGGVMTKAFGLYVEGLVGEGGEEEEAGVPAEEESVVAN